MRRRARGGCNGHSSGGRLQLRLARANLRQLVRDRRRVRIRCETQPPASGQRVLGLRETGRVQIDLHEAVEIDDEQTRFATHVSGVVKVNAERCVEVKVHGCVVLVGANESVDIACRANSYERYCGKEVKYNEFKARS